MPDGVKWKTETFAVEKIKVLIVDDNLINRKVACGFLGSYSFELFEAESGRQAIDMVKQTRFKLIFMDYMMPDMDGMEAARIIRSECGENGLTPIIVALTANVSEGVRNDFLQNGFQAFLAKPLDKKPLDDILKKWMPDGGGDADMDGGDTGGTGGVNAADADGGDAAEMGGSVSSELSFEDICIPGIDLEEAKKYNGGGVGNYLELLELYSLDGRRKLPFLSELLHKKEYYNYEIEVHALKSASAKLGAMELSARAREHETAAAEGNYEFIHFHFSELLCCYEALLKEIDRFLQGRKGAGCGREGSGAAIDSRTLLEEVRSALESVANFRSRKCLEKVEELLGCRLDDDVRKPLEAAREQLKMYEDDEAERLLRDLAEQIAGTGAAQDEAAGTGAQGDAAGTGAAAPHREEGQLYE